jgi:hypothetical protein
MDKQLKGTQPINHVPNHGALVMVVLVVYGLRGGNLKRMGLRPVFYRKGYTYMLYYGCAKFGIEFRVCFIYN